MRQSPSPFWITICERRELVRCLKSNNHTTLKMWGSSFRWASGRSLPFGGLPGGLTFTNSKKKTISNSCHTFLGYGGQNRFSEELRSFNCLFGHFLDCKNAGRHQPSSNNRTKLHRGTSDDGDDGNVSGLLRLQTSMKLLCVLLE